jgi:hypothetical protein
MTYVCPTWEFEADTNLLTLQRLQNKVLRTIGKISKAHNDVHTALDLPYVYDYITKLPNVKYTQPFPKEL